MEGGEEAAVDAPVEAAARGPYLAAHQPERLKRLQITGRIQVELARALESLDRH